jgi:hypothetical protein
MWVHGYWSYDWADSYTKVIKVDTTKYILSTDPNTPPVYGYKKNARYYVVNAISELDSVNEYYLDRFTGILYFIPPTLSSPTQSAIISISQNVLSLSQVEYMAWEGMVFDGTRSVCILAQKVNSVIFRHVKVTNTGDQAFQIKVFIELYSLNYFH